MLEELKEAKLKKWEVDQAIEKAENEKDDLARKNLEEDEALRKI